MLFRSISTSEANVKKTVTLAVATFVLVNAASFAQEPATSADQLYRDFKSAEFAWKLEPLPSPADWKTSCGPKSFGFYCQTESSERYLSLREKLFEMSKAGDAGAIFYVGVITLSDGDRFFFFKQKTAYEDALKLFKKSCALGVYTGCWNAGTMLLEGKAGVRSGSAAAE